MGKGKKNVVYYVEIRLDGKRWTLQCAERKHKDALHYVKEHAGRRYPMRIVRVERRIVFDGSKS